MREFVTVEEARATVLEAVSPGPVQTLDLGAVLGHTLAADVLAAEDLPAFDNAGMDGYAVRAGDLSSLPARLEIVAAVAAGSYPQQPVGPGRCVQIATGAPMPPGADAVVPVEWTDAPEGKTVLVRRAPEPGQYVRPAGQDVRRGARVLHAGTVVTPPVVGMLASLGRTRVPVHTPPRVAVLSTGDELVDASTQPGPGRLRDANGPALAAQLATAGAVATPLLRAGDTQAALRAAVEACRAADALVLSGGVSVGPYDLVRRVLEEAGATLHFWRVRQRPGKPLAFGVLDGKPVFALPGNPVSSGVCFEVYVRPALARMLGRPEPVRPLLPAVLDENLKKEAGLYHFVRGRAFHDEAGQLRVRGTGPQASNLYSSVVQANCLIHLPEAAAHPPAGTRVQVEILPW